MIHRGRVDHEIDDFLAHPAVLKVEDIGSTQAIHRMGVSNLAEDDFVAETRLGQHLDVRQAHRLGRVLDRPRRWPPTWRFATDSHHRNGC